MESTDFIQEMVHGIQIQTIVVCESPKTKLLGTHRSCFPKWPIKNNKYRYFYSFRMPQISSLECFRTQIRGPSTEPSAITHQ